MSIRLEQDRFSSLSEVAMGLSLVVLKQVLLREPGQPLQVLSQKGKLGFNTLPVCFVPSQPTPYYTTLALI